MVDTRTRSRAGIRATILAGLALAACGKAPSPDRELRIAVPYDLSSFDPHAKNGVGAYEAPSAVYEPLVSIVPCAPSRRSPSPGKRRTP
jgi:hypothetical protein